jgi:hypothetical protein
MRKHASGREQHAYEDQERKRQDRQPPSQRPIGFEWFLQVSFRFLVQYSTLGSRAAWLGALNTDSFLMHAVVPTESVFC